MYNKIKAIFFNKTFLRFIIVGIINTVFGTTIMFLCYNCFNLSYWWSSAANYILGSVLSFFLNKYYTFSNKSKDYKQVILFTVNICLCYFIAYGVAKPLVGFILGKCSGKVQGNIALFVGMCLFVCLNFIGQRLFVFVEPKKNEFVKHK